MKYALLLTSLIFVWSACLVFAGSLASRTTSLEKRASLQDSLFPSFHTYTAGFTTASEISVPGVSTVALSDSALNAIKVTSGLTHNVVTENGKTAWEAVYPQGSWNPSNTPKGGFGFYLNGSDAFASAIAAGAKQIIVGYSVMFQSDWEWNMGGKLPGGFGGVGSSAYACSGGRQEDRAECFDARLMWRTDGAGELYTYLPLTDANAAAQLAVPNSVQNTDFGFSVGRGAFTFPAGEWTTVLQRIQLNDPGQQNGQIRLWVNGISAIELLNISMRDSADSVIQGMHFQTFFGGSTSDWASPQTQKAWFADVSGAVVAS